MAREVYTNLDLNNNDLLAVDSIAFNTSSAHASAPGVLRWESGEGTLSVGLDTDVDLQIGQEMVVKCYNGTGSTIADGSVVYITGAQGNRPRIALADADTEAASSKTLGVATESISNGAEGFVTTFGMVRGLNTSALTAGSAVWLSQTTGGMTSTRPAAPAHAVFVGFCVKSDASSGEVFVNISNGWELNELHDVSAGSPTDGQVLTYESSTSLWKPSTPAGGTPLVLDMASGYYYTTPSSNSNTTITNGNVHYSPIIVSESTTFDRIGCRTANTFSGTASIRLGVYANNNGIPTDLMFDAGAVSCTAANTFYTITINQTLPAGIYWMAFASVTNAATNAFRTSITPYMQTHHDSTGGGGTATGFWRSIDVFGALPSTATVSSSGPNPGQVASVYLRKA